LAKPDEIDKSLQDVERISKQLDALDKRLDNVDSVVSAVAERVMKQPIMLTITCSHCGHKVEISLIGSERPGR
jgi:hypothetical protein